MTAAEQVLRRDWLAKPGASQAELQALQDGLSVELPESYVALLALTNGGEGPLAVQPYHFALDEADYVLRTAQSGRLEEFFPGFLVFGSNGGGEYIALDARGQAPWPVVALDMTNGDLDETVLAIAPDFDTFLDLVGIESPDLEKCSSASQPA